MPLLGGLAVLINIHCLARIYGSCRSAISNTVRICDTMVMIILTGRSGSFVVAPNPLGQAWRRGIDYCMATLAEDLLPYYFVVLRLDYRYFLGGCRFCTPAPKKRNYRYTRRPRPRSYRQANQHKGNVLSTLPEVRTADEHIILPGQEHSESSRICAIIEAIFRVILPVWKWYISIVARFCLCGEQHNSPWSFSCGPFKTISPNVTHDHRAASRSEFVI